MAGSRTVAWVSLVSFATVLAKSAVAADAAGPAAGESEPSAGDSRHRLADSATQQYIRQPHQHCQPGGHRGSGRGEHPGCSQRAPKFYGRGQFATGGQGGGGRATINLHGLGTNRNLVLLDGKRLPISDINGEVDINILPRRSSPGIDVITGGASAVYGSDAMSGVVNFKTIRVSTGSRPT